MKIVIHQNLKNSQNELTLNFLRPYVMKTLKVAGRNNNSEILIGESIGNLATYLPDGNVIVIADSNVFELYGRYFDGFPVIELESSETEKTIDTCVAVFEKMLSLNVDRSWFLLGVGGGIICDIAGFIASTFMRSIRFGFVSTTLLSQVDASTGGKNGINFKGFKNLIGTFNQPDFVICDPEMLKTLPEKEIRSGFGEIVKHALIADIDMFSFLEKNYQKALALDKRIIEELIYKSLEIKTGIVNQDELENGLRRKLNFGHTLAHAIEKCSAHFTHGEAVGLGIIAAAGMSLTENRISKIDLVRIVELLDNLGLPTETDIDKTHLFNAMIHDKKRQSDQIDLVLLNGIGSCVIVRKDIAELGKLVDSLELVKDLSWKSAAKKCR